MKRGGEDNEEECRNPKPLIITGNKSDLEGTAEGLEKVRVRYGSSYPVIGISAKMKEGLEDLRRTIFDHSGIIRVYSKEPGKEPDMKTPFTIMKGSTVIYLAELIHKDFVKQLMYACIWGSARYSGQRVQKNHVLHDKDIVEYHVA